VYHGIHNASTERVIVQQVSSPKPWDARFGGPRPSDVGGQSRGAVATGPAVTAGPAVRR
jgi:hypothetical protein